MIWAERPTLGELRAKVHKDRHREIGNWLARRIGRPVAVYGTWLAIRLGASADQVTLTALAVSVASACSIGMGTRSGFVVGVLLAQLAFLLDHVDGQVARWRGTASLDGVYFDYLMHHVISLTQGFALGFGLARQTGDVFWTLAGFSMGLGWLLISIHNDCRYKSFFQRLKRETDSFRVDGGAGGRPSPAASWSRKGLALLTWPAYKVCEAHSVLLGLTGLATVAIFWPEAWLALWRSTTLGMAVLAPLLATARSARSILHGAVETEFRVWFHLLSSERDDPNASSSDAKS